MKNKQFDHTRELKKLYNMYVTAVFQRWKQSQNPSEKTDRY